MDPDIDVYVANMQSNCDFYRGCDHGDIKKENKPDSIPGKASLMFGAAFINMLQIIVRENSQLLAHAFYPKLIRI